MQRFTECVNLPDRPDVTVTTDRFDLMDLKPGQSLEVTTHGSVYWVTRTTRAETRDGLYGRQYVVGFAMQSDSETIRQWRRPPSGCRLDRFVVIGDRFNVGNGMTSSVRSATVL